MNKSLPLRLYAGLALSIIIVLLVVFFTITALQKQEEGSKWVTYTLKVLDKVRDIRYTIVQMRGSRRVYWFTGRTHSLDFFYSGSSVLPNLVQDLKKEVEDNPFETLTVNRLDSSISNLQVFWSTDGMVSHEISKEKITSITEEEEKKLTTIDALFELIKAEESRLLAIRESNLSKYNSEAKQLIIGGIILLMIVVLVLVNAVIATLKSRYRAGNRLQASLAEMEKINAAAEENNWVLNGVAKINQQIQSADGTSNLSQDIISSIVDYMELPAGAIYLADDEGKTLTMTASVAVSKNAHSRCDVGVGIVGNAALHRTISLTKSIPDQYWKIESALGNTSGKGQIACVPLWVAEHLKGIVELGNLNEFSHKEILLLEAIITNLSTAIHARQTRVKINMLLEQVQEQKESMLSQQEELRQTNEELSKQAEELQASEEELRTQEEELRQINSELIEKNDTVENARQALILKAQELEATSKYKSEFLANMSHELRTPLNSVLILAKLLSDNNPNNLQPKQIEYAKIIHKSGADLLQLINDILDLSKIEAGRVELVIEKVSIESIVNDLSQLFSVVASEKGILYETKVAQTMPAFIHTDKQRTEQVLKNLLSNSFKFTPKGGSVTMSFESRDQFDRKRIAISVSDSGIGISKAKQQLIFEAFQQADGSTSRQYGGTGLGLSISKELAKLLGGEIEVNSEEGKGSTFTIILPLELKIEKKEQPHAPVHKQVNISLENVTEQEKVEDDRSRIKSNDKVMLIIEDDENFATILKDFARDKGYKPVVALKGDEGLLYAKKYQPDAIILDIQLPVIDGWSLLKELKSDQELSSIPVHIISAFDDIRLHNAGALAYVRKPIDRQGLETAFKTIDVYLNEHLKKILIISSAHFKDESLKQLFREKHHDVSFVQVATIDEAKEKLSREKYACLIADIDNNVTGGIQDLQLLQQEMHDHSIPVIIFLDTDISQADEFQLKKISDAIIRNSPSVNSRLKDELELFLYKVQESDQQQEEKHFTIPVDDSTLTNKKVLLVDDDMRNVFALSNALEMQQVQVITAADGKDALNKLKNDSSISLVLMDIMMPEMDGYEAIRKIRGELNLTGIPIIALTAKAMAGDREKCIAAGASDYITKPVDVQKLLSLMRVWLAK
jgi:signal transduction histidine kinase/CheY-like chemotaxis protein/CHASE3 domain sensor protein